MKRILASLILALTLTAHSAEPVLVAYMAAPGERTVTLPNGQPALTGVVLIGTFTGAPNAQLRGFTVLHGTSLRRIAGQPGRFAGMVNLQPTGQKLWVFVRTANGAGLFSSSAWTLPAAEGVFVSMFCVASDIDQAIAGEVTAQALVLK